jgi:hypothetical protein
LASAFTGSNPVLPIVLVIPHKEKIMNANRVIAAHMLLGMSTGKFADDQELSEVLTNMAIRLLRKKRKVKMIQSYGMEFTPSDIRRIRYEYENAGKLSAVKELKNEIKKCVPSLMDSKRAVEELAARYNWKQHNWS